MLAAATVPNGWLTVLAYFCLAALLGWLSRSQWHIAHGVDRFRWNILPPTANRTLAVVFAVLAMWCLGLMFWSVRMWVW